MTDGKLRTVLPLLRAPAINQEKKNVSIITKQNAEYIKTIYLKPCILVQTAKSAVICCMFDSFNECSDNISPPLPQPSNCGILL